MIIKNSKETNLKIGIIDDNKTVLMVTEIMLKKEKFVSENDVIEKFTDISSFCLDNQNDFIFNFDIIICDYDLGKDSISGLDFFKKLKGIGFNGQCILQTGDDSITMKTKMLLHPNIHYIVKNAEKNNNNTIFQLGELINNYRVQKGL